MGVNTKAKLRDADRSRAAILGAAERLFAGRGFDGASLADIAADAGVSRATPSYFFGSKEELYLAVLEEVFRDRQSAATFAFEPLHAWVRDAGDATSLRARRRRAADGYMSFLLERPTFVRLLQHEDLAGGQHLAMTPRDPNAMAQGFEALRRVAKQRGLRQFRVDHALFLFISLTFSPLTQGSTFMAVLGRDLREPRTRQRHIAFVADQLLHLIEGCTT